MTEEGVLDPWVAKWMEDNPLLAHPLEEFPPEILELARGPVGPPTTREVARITDEVIEDVPVRMYEKYENEAPHTGLVVYFHGGGWVIGSIGVMDNVARELAHATGAVVVSVGYRLAPEHPYPSGLDDCEKITRWAFGSLDRFALTNRKVAVAGESAGGNLSAAVALRLRDRGEHTLAAQVLMYPAVDGPANDYPSWKAFDGLVLTRKGSHNFWDAYSGGRDITGDPFACPIVAKTLKGLPPAFVLVGGCDVLRDEGRAFAARLREEGVAVEEMCAAGQPHGFLNHGFPAAAEAFHRIGTWVRTVFAQGT